ncbi:MAG TPA: DUF4349 domain-containing protein [Polyangiaceae bacterium]|jgi:hypothetical protein
MTDLGRVKRGVRVAVLVLGVLLGLAGCGGAQDKVGGAAAAPMNPEPPAPPPPPPGAPAAAGDIGGQVLAMNDAAQAVAATKSVADAPHSAAMLIYTANLSMSVFQVGPQLDAVEQLARDLGGYLSSRQDAAITIRVPRDRFEDALARIEKLGEVTHRDIKAQDVTDEFVDVQARLKNAYAMRDKLTELLSKAAVKDALEIEKELGRVTGEIERMEGRLKLLKDQIAFSTVTVTFAALDAQQVHESSLLLPFPWLQQLGLHSLLQVHQ